MTKHGRLISFWQICNLAWEFRFGMLLLSKDRKKLCKNASFDLENPKQFGYQFRSNKIKIFIKYLLIQNSEFGAKLLLIKSNSVTILNTNYRYIIYLLLERKI